MGAVGSRESCVGSSPSVLTVVPRDAGGRPGARAGRAADGCSARDGHLEGSGRSFGFGLVGCRGRRGRGGRRGRLLPGAYPSVWARPPGAGRGNGCGARARAAHWGALYEALRHRTPKGRLTVKAACPPARPALSLPLNFSPSRAVKLPLSCWKSSWKTFRSLALNHSANLGWKFYERRCSQLIPAAFP